MLAQHPMTITEVCRTIYRKLRIAIWYIMECIWDNAPYFIAYFIAWLARVALIGVCIALPDCGVDLVKILFILGSYLSLATTRRWNYTKVYSGNQLTTQL